MLLLLRLRQSFLLTGPTVDCSAFRTALGSFLHTKRGTQQLEWATDNTHAHTHTYIHTMTTAPLTHALRVKYHMCGFLSTPGFHTVLFGGGGEGERSLWGTAAVACTSKQHTHVSVCTSYRDLGACHPPGNFFLFRSAQIASHAIWALMSTFYKDTIQFFKFSGRGRDSKAPPPPPCMKPCTPRN